MPNRRRSISVWASRPRIEVRAGGCDLTGYRCRVGHVRHDGPPGRGRDATCAPGGPGGAGRMASSAVGDRHLQAAGAVAASTPLQRSSLVICPASIAAAGCPR